MAQAVADSSSLIHLEKIGQLALRERLFEQVAIPQAVANEVKRTLPELPSWIYVHTLSRPIPPAIARRSLGAGESEAMALALELRIPRVILDELLPPQPEGLANAAARSRRSGVTSAARRYERDSLRS